MVSLMVSLVRPDNFVMGAAATNSGRHRPRISTGVFHVAPETVETALGVSVLPGP